MVGVKKPDDGEDGRDGVEEICSRCGKLKSNHGKMWIDGTSTKKVLICPRKV